MDQRERHPQRFVEEIPTGDDRQRRVCDHCGFVDYDNPKIIVGSVATWGDEILLCRRAIEPRSGYWTLPAGFMEERETAEEGTKREAWEEARVRLTIDRLLAVYSVPRISQVQLIYRAALQLREFAPGPESADVALFKWDDIPWTDVAFPTVGWALRHYHESRGRADFAPFSNPQDGL